MTRQVVIAPGLWMPGAAMALLAARLGGHGYAAHVFSYSGRKPLDTAVERLARFADGKRLFVGHSLGGVLILEMLERHPEVAADAAVLIGAPVRGSLAGRRLGAAELGRWMMGASKPLWDERPARWTRATPLGVIAGTTPLGLGRAFGSLPGVNDGVVCVDETSVDGMTERALVARGHSMLIVSGRVSDMVARFLGAGRFS